MPFGPSERVSAMLLVNGGEIRGSVVTAPRNHFIQAGMDIRVTAYAYRYPRKVPATATAVASQMLLTNALLKYHPSSTSARLEKERRPSATNAVRNSLSAGYSTNTARESHIATSAEKSAGSRLISEAPRDSSTFCSPAVTSPPPRAVRYRAAARLAALRSLMFQ